MSLYVVFVTVNNENTGSFYKLYFIDSNTIKY